jgi:hypothetical protein
LFFEKGKATTKTWFYQLNLDRNLGKTNPLNEKVFLKIIPPLPPAFSILIKCCKNKLAVSPVLIGKFCCTSARSLPPKGGFAKIIS